MYNDSLKAVTDSGELTIGDLLFRRKGMVMHVGIYLGNTLILHNTPKAGEHQVDFITFANGKEVYAKSSGLHPDEVLRKARQVLDEPANYRLFRHNCEHTANRVLDGQAISHQLSEIETWALIGGALGKSVGKKSMYIGGFIGALGGLLSLPRMRWLK
ncbi:MAG: cell wall-associated NlpC family hydrolase [Alteromonadaceae bacterium]|jgi:cell wall-associated NlpC family hydrolase